MSIYVHCDGCGVSMPIDDANKEAWREVKTTVAGGIGTKHYCPDCWHDMEKALAEVLGT